MSTTYGTPFQDGSVPGDVLADEGQFESVESAECHEGSGSFAIGVSLSKSRLTNVPLLRSTPRQPMKADSKVVLFVDDSSVFAPCGSPELLFSFSLTVFQSLRLVCICP